VPWHRVLNAAGRVSARSDGSDGSEQLRRLAREGVRPGPRGAIDLARRGWRTVQRRLHGARRAGFDRSAYVPHGAR
jgi:hypothetical protein